MKKILKIALVLTTLALFSTACSNVKSTNLIGTYKNGNYSVTVDADGYASFRYSGSTDTATMVGMSDADFSSMSAFSSMGYMELIPWDLTSEKATYEYSDERDLVYGYDTTNGTDKTTKITVTLKFTKDKESVKCEASWTLTPDNLEIAVGTDTNTSKPITKTFKSGSITLTK